MKVLIVEDDASQRFLYRKALGINYEAIIVGSVEEAWPYILPDLDMLITDKDLGLGLTGIELCELAHELFPDLPIIIVTADTAIVSPSYAFVLFKPFTFAKLLYCIEKLARPK